MCVFKQFKKKKKKKNYLYIYIYIWGKKKERKKKCFYTNLCRFEIFSMKIVYAMEPEL